jgi:hypothetical protein
MSTKFFAGIGLSFSLFVCTANAQSDGSDPVTIGHVVNLAQIYSSDVWTIMLIVTGVSLLVALIITLVRTPAIRSSGGGYRYFSGGGTTGSSYQTESMPAQAVYDTSAAHRNQHDWISKRNDDIAAEQRTNVQNFVDHVQAANDQRNAASEATRIANDNKHQDDLRRQWEANKPQ